MIAIVNYGLGNLYSIRRSLDYIGQESIITRDPAEILAADRVILPGVGAFRDAAKLLSETGLDAVVKAYAATGKPLLGICLGMQLLFEKSYEYGEYEGLGLLPGQVCSLEADLSDLKVPHIGWNALRIRKEIPLLKYSKEGDCVYYVHSFYAKNCDDVVAADSEYGVRVPGAVARGNVMGTQFHPEKSGPAGLAILRAFAEL
ncbi:MAG: imidazole glycerol phosphate synthase subunit HisH [Clostridiales bacterium]|nr:imidazole glycerol phosphate synthase subunit HisH [Clostridiales bacterium]